MFFARTHSPCLNWAGAVGSRATGMTARQHLVHVVCSENAFDRLGGMDRPAGGDLVGGDEAALGQQLFEPGEPELVIALGKIIGRRTILDRKAPHIYVPYSYG